MNELLNQALLQFRDRAVPEIQRLAAVRLEKNPGAYFKYERGILTRIADPGVRGQLLRSRLVNDVSEFFRVTLDDAFTIENLKAHETLLNKKLMGGGNSVFLESQIRSQIYSMISRSLKNSPFQVGYRGDAMNLTVTISESILFLYGAAVQDLLNSNAKDQAAAPDVPEQIRIAASEGMKFKVTNGRFGINAEGLPDASHELVELVRELLSEVSYVELSLANAHPRLLDSIRKYRKEINKSTPSPLRNFSLEVTYNHILFGSKSRKSWEIRSIETSLN